MKSLTLYLISIFTSTIVYSQKNIKPSIDSSFILSYKSVGLGSNMFQMQPMFQVSGTNFIYTSEESWHLKDSERPKVDTLLIGVLRSSSIDSILNLVKEVKGDSVYKLNAGIMSGGIVYLNITSLYHKLNFRLDNSFDLIARKIIDILNAYIPDRYHKLWISDDIATIIKIK